MKKILVLEDDASMRENILELLSAEGYSVAGAENGVEGVRMAREVFPDLIICDILMSRLDGYGVLATLRHDKNMATIPVVFLTALTGRLDQRKGMDLGADDYITKPFTRDELLKAIRVRLERQETLSSQAQKKMVDLRTSITLAMPHELLTPLSVILGFSELLMNDYQKLQREQILEVSRDINQSAQRLLRLVQNYLLFAEIEIVRGNPERISLFTGSRLPSAGRVIEEIALAEAEGLDRQGDLSVAVEDVTLQVAEVHLHKIVEELLDNAFKFSLPGSPVTLTGKAGNDRTCYTITISDRGRGMDPQQIAEIGGFMQFDRKIYEQQGSGMGLVLVKGLVELYDGQFGITSQPGDGTVVQVTLLISPQPAPPS